MGSLIQCFVRASHRHIGWEASIMLFSIPLARIFDLTPLVAAHEEEHDEGEYVQQECVHAAVLLRGSAARNHDVPTKC
eukprot:749017-Hanusia_phi.AAC.9